MKSKPLLLTAAIALTGLGAVLWWNAAHKPPSNTNTEIQKPKPPVLSPSVAAILTRETSPLAVRLANLATIGASLSPDERHFLLASISNTSPNGLSNDDWYVLANDILAALRCQQPYTPEYTDCLLALWHDKTLDPTLRDYTLQQLREWVADSDTRTVHEVRSEKISLIQQSFLDAVTPGHPTCDPQSTTTGTALLALDEWTSQPSSIHNQNLTVQGFNTLLVRYSADPASHRGVRSTALQLCARRKLPEALPIARTIAADNASAAILRISAISLLGSLGTPDDRALLTNLQQANASDPLLQASLQKAIKEISR